MLAKRQHPQIEVVGLDPDPKALEVAIRKSDKAGAAIHFDRGFADDLSYPDESFDRVVSSFMFHHLTRAEKLDTLREVRRVLRHGGSLHLLDFGPPKSRYSSLLTRLLHNDEHVRDNIEGRIPSLMSDSGLAEPSEVAHRSTAFGPISYYRAVRPAN